MSVREIVVAGDPVLNKRCHPVTKFDEKLGCLLDDLKETLAKANGLGLAAPQIGILRRVTVVVTEDGKMLELVNPEILESKGEQNGLEGCLSVPGKWGYVKRPSWVKIKAQDRNGNWFEREGEDITARCYCHEFEHLDGHLYVEHVDKLYTNEDLDKMAEEQEAHK